MWNLRSYFSCSVSIFSYTTSSECNSPYGRTDYDTRRGYVPDFV